MTVAQKTKIKLLLYYYLTLYLILHLPLVHNKEVNVPYQLGDHATVRKLVVVRLLDLHTI